MRRGVFRKVGQWDKAQALTANVGYEMVIARDEALRQIAEKAENVAKRRIRRQEGGWAPLNRYYRNKKIKQGYSGKKLIRKGEYLAAIMGWKHKHKAYAGVKKGAINSDGELLSNIARAMEYGVVTRSIPARPLWRYVTIEVRKWLWSKDLPVNIFLRNLRRKYGVRTNGI